MSRQSIRLRLLAALAAGLLAAAVVRAGASRIFSPRATLTFAASASFFPEEFSRNGSRLLGRIYRGPDETYPLAVWDVATGKQVARFTDLPRRVTFTPDGQLAFVDGRGRLVLRDPATLSEQVTAVGGLPPETKPAFSSDGKLFATMEWMPNAKTGQVRLWDLTSGKGRVIADNKGEPCVGAIQFSPDGRKLGALFANGTVRIWETRTGGN